MSRRTLVPILLSTVMILAGTATAAGGTGPPPGAPQWPGTWICADGTLANTGIDPATITLTGSIQPCAGTDPATVADASWGIAKFHTSGGYVYADRVRVFTSTTEPTAVVAEVAIGGYEAAVWGPLEAACLVTSPGLRLACVGVTTEWNGNLLVEPIPVDDARVTVGVTVVEGNEPDPECGACV